MIDIKADPDTTQQKKVISSNLLLKSVLSNHLILVSQFFEFFFN